MNDLIFRLVLLQVALPTVVVALNAIVPNRSMLGWILRTLGVFALLIYVALVGVWLFPPWWTPFALIIPHAAVSYYRFRHLSSETPVRTRWWRRAELAIGSLICIGAAWLLTPVLQGRSVQSIAIDLKNPLGPGTYLVTSGGANQAINAHFLTLDLDRAAAFRGQSFGVDIIGIDAWGFRADGISPRDPNAYRIHGVDVLAPCSGRVLEAKDGVADNDVPTMNRTNMTGNAVLLECNQVQVLLAHLMPGSVSVVSGEQVEVGQRLGRVGNSGNSAEPHLHIHVQRAGSPETPLSGDPLWFTIDGRFIVRNDRLLVEGSQ